MQIKRIANLLGFTKTEFAVILFLIIIFFTGITIKFFQKEDFSYKNYDYSLSDSLFYAADSLSSENQFTSLQKNVDYKGKVLDFSSEKLKKIEKKSLPEEKSINLNNAELQELLNLPGIGEKIALRILEYRNQKGKFDNIEELKEIKGIQTKKFNQIKNYIFIE